MKKTYFENLDETIINANFNSLRYGDGDAWANVKRKNHKQYCPRGPAYLRLRKIESIHKWQRLTAELEEQGIKLVAHQEVVATKEGY